MAEFTVNITCRPFGVRFAQFDHKLVGVEEVKPGSAADKLGLLAGDVLIEINNDSIIDIKSSEVLDLFRLQKLPFTATFERFSDDYQSESDSNPPFPEIPTSNTPDVNLENPPIAVINSNDTETNENYHQLLHNMSTMYDSDSAYSLSFDFVDSASDQDHDVYPESKTNDTLEAPPGSLQPANTPIIKPFDELAEVLLTDNNFLSLPIMSPEPTPEPSSEASSSTEPSPGCMKPPSISLRLSSFSDGLSYRPPTMDVNAPHNNHDEFVYVTDPDHEQQLECSYDDIDHDTKAVVDGYIRHLSTSTTQKRQQSVVNMLVSKYLYNNTVMFDEQQTYPQSDDKVVMLSGFKYGVHEWEIKILKCDVQLQEVGVISTDQINEAMIQDGGVRNSPDFGARAVYGNCLLDGVNYYASFNDDNKTRCDKDLSKLKIHRIGWCTHDTIKVVLNLRKSVARFYLNDQKVRKVISLQKDKVYYPFISFSGNCKYELVQYS